MRLDVGTPILTLCRICLGKSIVEELAWSDWLLQTLPQYRPDILKQSIFLISPTLPLQYSREYTGWQTRTYSTQHLVLRSVVNTDARLVVILWLIVSGSHVCKNIYWTCDCIVIGVEGGSINTITFSSDASKLQYSKQIFTWNLENFLKYCFCIGDGTYHSLLCSTGR